ncbi:hypothetical protein OG728_39535 (plasmid) [Streptomyces microflavus]|uniref:hypothetical protein n=1 Tax=Streptomyces microflavus TaxID=1919 RepID=UPI002E0D41B7|nr:hypothetical protein OG728_38230 [Streptomyces microflavus]WSR96566.1 hypothetical protein OG728_39535 [Streptomyces microflavus]
MSEQRLPVPDDFRTGLAELGEGAYALAWVAGDSRPTAWTEVAPRVGESGIARPGADLTRITLQEVTHGPHETLRRWVELDDGVQHLAIITAEPDGLREHTPGELAAHLVHDPADDQAQLTDLLAGWLYRRNAQAPQGLELGWITAAAAWTCHMRALSAYPPFVVLAQSLQRAGEQDESITDLVVDTGLRIADLLDRLERPFRPRADLIDMWHAVETLSADVPILADTADWLLDQISLRDAPAQQLRAVLEPDISDYLRDQSAGGHSPDVTLPALDAPRAAQLATARETVRAYTTAAYAGREQEARQLQDAFPVPGRALATSGPAALWRQNSATARDAVDDLTAQRAATTAEDSTDYFADPELLHAQTAYLAAREGQLLLLHDALGRLAFPASAPRDLPKALAPVAAAQTQRRVIEAFGTPERAAQALDGQLHYQRQRPVPAHQRATAGTETELLTRTRAALEPLTAAVLPLDQENIRSRVQEAMSRPAAPVAGLTPVPVTHTESHARAQNADPDAVGVHR